MPCSFRRPDISPEVRSDAAGTLHILMFRFPYALVAAWLCATNLHRIADLIWRAIHGPEPLARRMKTLVHTGLGVYLAALLRRRRISHLHVHHGYFSAWSGMVAARILRISFSMTLHGSDLLIRTDYLDAKLKNRKSCVTVSEFNRNYIAQHYPEVDCRKILLHLVGINVNFWQARASRRQDEEFSILTAGRLEAVKNQGFLMLACRELKTKGVRFRCLIAMGKSEEIWKS